jgi:sugar lactone lactonase YvrE
MSIFVRILVLFSCLLAAAAGQSPRAKTPGLLQLSWPNGLAFGSRGELYISDLGTHRIVKLTRLGRLVAVAGTGAGGFGGDGGPALQAQLHAPHDLAFDAEGNLYIADSGNHRIRRVDRRGVITTVAGDGQTAKTGYNDPPRATSLNNPQSLAFDRDGTLLIADTYNHVVRRLDHNGAMTIFAGSAPGHGGDGGPATKAQISLPMAVAVAPDGSVYISDAGNSRIRRVGPDGTIQTVAGYGPAQDTYGGGYAGDGGPLAKAKLFSVTDLKFDAAGNLYIADSGNHRIRAVRNDAIATLAGTGEMGFSGDGGKATEARLNTPQKVAIARDGTVFITDRVNHRIRRVDSRGAIATIVSGGPPARKMLNSGIRR